MNNAKMWLVVSPTVGIPLFLGAVAVSSFAVHVAVLRNTTWVADFLAGRPMGSSAATAELTLPGQDSTQKAAWLTNGSQQVIITLPDGTKTVAVISTPQEVAALR